VGSGEHSSLFGTKERNGNVVEGKAPLEKKEAGYLRLKETLFIAMEKLIKRNLRSNALRL